MAYGCSCCRNGRTIRWMTPRLKLEERAGDSTPISVPALHKTQEQQMGQFLHTQRDRYHCLSCHIHHVLAQHAPWSLQLQVWVLMSQKCPSPASKLGQESQQVQVPVCGCMQKWSLHAFEEWSTPVDEDIVQHTLLIEPLENPDIQWVKQGGVGVPEDGEEFVCLDLHLDRAECWVAAFICERGALGLGRGKAKQDALGKSAVCGEQRERNFTLQKTEITMHLCKCEFS